MVALMTALLAVCSWISIPLTVPITLQTFAIFVGVCVLGEKKATFALLAHLFLGVVGVPVFANFQSGIGALSGPTGGFIVGFLFIPLCSSVFARLLKNKPWARYVGLAIGLVACYLLGVTWYSIVYLKQGLTGFLASVVVCVLPYILPDAIKLLLAITVSKAVKKAWGSEI